MKEKHNNSQNNKNISDGLQTAKEEKQRIMDQLFIDINNVKCVLDICLKEKNIENQRLNCESIDFLNSSKEKLLKEYNGGNVLFFRKYAYEKILNEYLQKKYKTNVIELDVFESGNKYLEEKRLEQREKEEKQLINKIQKMKWTKTFFVGFIKFESVTENGKTVELFYKMHPSKKEINKYNKLIYDGKSVSYVPYEFMDIITKIESTCPEKKISGDMKTIIINNQFYQRNKVDEKKKNKEFQQKIDEKRKWLSKNYKISEKEINKISAKCFSKCKHYVPSRIHCKLNGKMCSPLFEDCIYYEDLIKKVLELKEKKEKEAEERKKQELKAKRERIAKRLFKPLPLKTIEELESNKHKELEKNVKQNNTKNITKIGFKDFVVRSNVFKCTHDKHKIDNVVAEIYIDEDGKKHLEKISAGYCPQCNIYFIMESTYENLKRRGIILCRISDRKNYMKMIYSTNGLKLAKESILMQYGYNVSQIKGLSKLRRQKILAVIIDNDVLSKSEIISYLDFFIRQRSHMSNMETAISKWEEDEEFVEHYRIGEYTKFGVNAIYRRIYET